ncbi:unnamed protein product [Allacma fusca]|uniref:NADP-dependent oxidoreductase domain-containing protein n=1 Tax=Allacma fusca TaxID=39272 RepID=A0A8J2PGS2_9HEXA|nr:unnamed protein product [Allacma fusca]
MTTGFLKLFDNNQLPLVGWAPGKDVEKSLEAALRSGCRFIWTDYNNQDEIEVGRVLSRWFRENDLKRKNIFVSVKLPFIGNHHTRVQQFARKSLENLRLGYVDLFLISAPVGFKYTNDNICFPFKNNMIDLDRQTDIISIWKAVERVADAGMTKSIGLCHFNERQLKIIVRNARVPPAVLQVECHAYFQQRELQAFCNKYEIAIYSVFPAGYNNGNFCAKTLSTNLSQQDNLIPKFDPLIRKLGYRHDTNPYQILVAFLVQSNIGVVVSDTEASEIPTYSQVLNFQLKNDELEAIAELNKGSRGRTFNFRDLLPGFDTHPQHPFHDVFNLEFAILDFPRNWN